MIGIDISDQSIKIVRLANSVPHRLLNYCWQEIPPKMIEKGVIHDVAAMSKLVHAVWRKCNLGKLTEGAVVASIPETQSFLRVMEIPQMDEAEITEAIQWEVAHHIPFGIENVYIDWQPVRRDEAATLARGGEKQEVLVGAAEKSVVDPLLQVLRSLNLDVAALELEGQAIVRALISSELKQRRGLLIVDVGGSATNVIIHDQGTIRFTASLAHGSANMIMTLSAAESQAIRRPSGQPLNLDLGMIADKLQAPMVDLIAEIKGIVDFYNGVAPDHSVKEILLTGGGANLPGLDRVVSQYFDNVHIQRGNPWLNILLADGDNKPPLGVEETVHYSTAIGLALRVAML